MTWMGKAVGGLLGFAAAGPIGSVLGLLAGHQFDRGYARRPPRIEELAASRIPDAFFAATFAMMGRVAKADGRVLEQDIRAARGIMHGMRLTPEQQRSAIDHFTDGKRSDYPMAERLSELARHIGHRPDLCRAFVEIQMQALVAGGSPSASKRELIWRLAQRLGIGRAELAQIEALARAREQGATVGSPRAALEEAYRVLGVSVEASDEDVKTAYRRLMNQHHPDKLVSRGLPKSMLGVAQEKTREIRTAYERIKAHRQRAGS